MIYNGVDLEKVEGEVARSHSVVLDILKGESSSQNTSWTDLLAETPWSLIKDKMPEAYEESGRLWSLIGMNCQVCNGGIEQYFFNGYHTENEPYHENDVCRYDIDEQKTDFLKLVDFGQVIFPERVEENTTLLRAATAFNELEFEERAEIEVLVECDEDRYIWDDDLEEEVENPDWFEEYYETEYEDVIHNEDGFNDIFYEANEYLEELFEMKAQLIYKTISIELDKTLSNDQIGECEVSKQTKTIDSLIDEAKKQSFGYDNNEHGSVVRNNNEPVI